MAKTNMMTVHMHKLIVPVESMNHYMCINSKNNMKKSF